MKPGKGRQGIYTAIDVGTSKVCTVVAHPGPRGELEVLGVGVVPSAGMKKGMVVDISEVQQVVRSSLEEAEKAAGVKITSAYIGITGQHITSCNTRVTLTNRAPRAPVSVDDLDQAIAASRLTRVEEGREVLHFIPLSYAVDDHPAVKNPVGMLAHKLQVESLSVLAPSNYLENLLRAVRGAQVEVQGVVLEPLACGEAVLSGDERELGVVLVDIGGGTSDLAIFDQGAIRFTKIIPVGGFQFTNDLAAKLGTPYRTAEQVKIRYGHVLPDEVEPEEEVELEGFGGLLTAKRGVIMATLRERAVELIGLIAAVVQEAGWKTMPPAGLVLAGGTANLPGFDRLAQELLRCSVRVGRPRGFSGLEDRLHNPTFATSMGILLWAVHSRSGQRRLYDMNLKTPKGGAWSRFMRWWRQGFRWFPWASKSWAKEAKLWTTEGNRNG